MTELKDGAIWEMDDDGLRRIIADLTDNGEHPETQWPNDVKWHDRPFNDVLAEMGTWQMRHLILRQGAHADGFVSVEGIVDLDGSTAFARDPDICHEGEEDVFLSQSQVDLGLRHGDRIVARGRPPDRTAGQKFYSAVRILAVNYKTAERPLRQRPWYHKKRQMVPVHPNEGFDMSGDSTLRVLHTFATIGKGQKGLVLSHPGSGKTTIIHRLANAVRSRVDHVVHIGVGERAEETTEMRAKCPHVWIVASDAEEKARKKVSVARLAMHACIRLVEEGCDVVVSVDNITRLTVAINNIMPGGGRTLTGGLSTYALDGLDLGPGQTVEPLLQNGSRWWLAQARAVQGGGSLTVIATCLIDDHAKLIQTVQEEFTGTGNLQWPLDRDLAAAECWPALDLRNVNGLCFTRNDLLLKSPEKMALQTLARQVITMGPGMPIGLQRAVHEAIGAAYVVNPLRGEPGQDEFVVDTETLTQALMKIMVEGSSALEVKEFLDSLPPRALGLAERYLPG